MGGHGHGHGHGHRHRGHGFRGGFYPAALIYELGCDPSDPLYLDCVNRFGNDEPTFAGLTTPDDIDAIRKYFDQTPINNPVAQPIKDEFVRWYDSLTWYDKTQQATFDLARNQRNRFNLANARTPDELETVKTVIAQGTSEEQLQGLPDRRLADGMLPGPVKPPPPPLISKPVLIGAGVVAGLAIIASAYGYGRR